MSNFRARPRIRMYTSIPANDLIAKFQNGLVNPQNKFRGTVIQHHVIIKIPRNEQHFWSPELHLTVEKADDNDTKATGETLIRGNIGPKSSVWTMFMFFYILMGVLSLFGGMVGFSQWTLGKTPWGFWFLAGGSFLIVLLYLSAVVGRNLAAKQTNELLQFLKQNC